MNHDRHAEIHQLHQLHMYMYIYEYICKLLSILYIHMCVYEVSTHILTLAVRPITLSDCIGRSLEGLAMQWDIKKRVATKTAIHKTDGE